ncbi:MAG: hypothetical protein WBV73_07770 [Phormidium sp.]
MLSTRGKFGVNFLCIDFQQHHSQTKYIVGAIACISCSWWNTLRGVISGSVR